MTDDEAIERLLPFGITRDQASRLVREHGADDCARQAEWINLRPNVKNVAAVLITAIDQNWSDPTPDEPPKPRRPAVWAPPDDYRNALSPDRWAEMRAIDALNPDDRDALRKRAVIELAFRVVGAKRAAELRAENKTPTFAEFKARWLMPERLYPIVLESLMRDIYVGERGVAVEVSMPFKDGPEESDIDRVVRIVEGAS